MTLPNQSLNKSQRVDFLAELRRARAVVLRDSESFHVASTVLEHIGQGLANQVRNGLGRFEGEILALASETGRNDRDEVARLYNVVREARNMAVHEGAWARHLSSRLVDLFLILEEALMKSMLVVEDLMVRDPVTVQTWHLVAHARKTMLANSFSYLPIFSSGRWRILTDLVVMRFLRGAETKNESDKRLSMQLCTAIEGGHLEAMEARCCPPRTPVAEVSRMMTALPVLITDETSDEPRLLGIITPFDLL